MLRPLLNRRNDLLIRKGLLLYKKLIHPMTDYACPALRSAARTQRLLAAVVIIQFPRLAVGAPLVR
jgi:hypothetical protein